MGHFQRLPSYPARIPLHSRKRTRTLLPNSRPTGHWPALPFGNRSERQQDSAVGKIGAGNDILDPVENDRAGGRKQNFVLIAGPIRCSAAQSLGPRRRASSPHTPTFSSS